MAGEAVAAQAGNVNEKWPHRAGQKWPHPWCDVGRSVVVTGQELDGLGDSFLAGVGGAEAIGVAAGLHDERVEGQPVHNRGR